MVAVLVSVKRHVPRSMCCGRCPTKVSYGRGRVRNTQELVDGGRYDAFDSTLLGHHDRLPRCRICDRARSRQTKRNEAEQ
jgi:hypothetical protein